MAHRARGGAPSSTRELRTARGGAIKCVPPSREMLDAWVELRRQIPHARGRCTACGSMDIEGTAWIDAAGVVIDAWNEGPLDSHYCHGCETHGTLVEWFEPGEQISPFVKADE